MQISRKAAPIVGLLTLGLLTVGPAMAQTVITLNNNLSDGYVNCYDDRINFGYETNDPSPSTNYYGTDYGITNYGVTNYIVTPRAEFNGNTYAGLVALNSTVTVNGGQFDNNFQYGIYADNSTVTITGGQFEPSSSSQSFASADVFSEGGSTVTITGGMFQANKLGFVTTAGNILLYGNFGDLPGGQETFFENDAGAINGTLENGDVLNDVGFDDYTGSITLINVATTPEPSGVVTLAWAAFGLTGLILTARKRRMA
jgi:hypothetical protein